MKERVWPWVVLLVAMSVLLLAVSGCELTPEDRALVRSFAEDWARSARVSPVTEDGSLDPEGLWNLGSRFLTGSSGDEIADAALDTIDTIASISKGDNLMGEGRRDRDGTKMDEAIGLRPADWTYRVSRAALALEEGDVDAWADQLKIASNVAAQQKANQQRYASQVIDDLEQVKGSLGTGLYSNGAQCRALLDSLASYYRVRFESTGSAVDAQMAAQYEADKQWCR